MKARRVSKVHLEYFDDGRWHAACGVSGGTWTGDADEVTCVTCANSRHFRNLKEATKKEEQVEESRNRLHLPKLSFAVLKDVFSRPRFVGRESPKGDGLDIIKSTKTTPGLRARPVLCAECGHGGGTMVNNGRGHVHRNCAQKIASKKG